MVPIRKPNKDRRIQILFKVAKLVNSNLELKAIFNHLVKIATKEFDCDTCSIMIKEKDKLIVKENYGYDISKLKKPYFNINKGILGQVARSGKPAIIESKSKNKDFIPLIKGNNSELCVPIKARNKIIGIFNLESRKTRAFNEYDLNLLIAIGNQAGIAIENARLVSALKDHSQHLKMLYEAGKTISSSLNIEFILNQILSIITEEFNYSTCAILLREKDKLIVKENYGYAKNINGLVLDLGEGIAGTVAKTGKPELINDTTKDKRYFKVLRQNYSEICVPITTKNKVMGILCVESKEKNAFTKDDLKLVWTLADQAAMSIENASLYQKIKDSSENLKQRVGLAVKELKEKNETLEKLNQVKSDFVSTVSHELRTPLTSIKGFTEAILENNPTKEQQKEFLKIIKEESNRLTRLINDLLDIQKIESGKIELDMQTINLKTLIESKKEEFQGIANEKNINYVTELPKSEIKVRADKDKLSQILTNLVDNAIKYTNPNGKVLLKVLNKKGAIQIDVKDTGIGIPKKDLPLIFEKFHQVDMGESRIVGGTGLGLAICKSLVQEHRGEIWAKSRFNRGTTFSFTLPK